jgi:hypothetical protein
MTPVSPAPVNTLPTRDREQATTAATAKTGGVPPNTTWPVANKISDTDVIAGGITVSATPLVEMTSGIVGHLLAWEDHTCLLCTSDVAG